MKNKRLIMATWGGLLVMVTNVGCNGQRSACKTDSDCRGPGNQCVSSADTGENCNAGNECYSGLCKVDGIDGNTQGKCESRTCVSDADCPALDGSR